VDVLKAAFARWPHTRSCRAPREALSLSLTSRMHKDEHNKLWAAMNLWFGRYHLAAELLGSVDPKLKDIALCLIDILDGVHFTCPGARAPTSIFQTDRGKDGYLYSIEGEYDVHLGGSAKIGYRAYMSHDRATADTPLIIYFHGADELVADFTPEEPHVVAFSMICSHVLFVGYRGNCLPKERCCTPEQVHQSNGDMVSHDEDYSTQGPWLSMLLADAEALVEALPAITVQCELPWPYPGNVVIMGSSLGSLPAVHIAALYGSKIPVSALILESAIGCHWPWSQIFREDSASRLIHKLLDAALPHLVPLDLNPSSLSCSRFSCDCCGLSSSACTGTIPHHIIAECSAFLLDTADKVALHAGPLLLLHGQEDEVCPLDQAFAIQNAASGPTRLIQLAACGHGDLAFNKDSDIYWSEVERFLWDVAVYSVDGLWPINIQEDQWLEPDICGTVFDKVD